jgi:arylsulfatase A-like enzyme
MLLAAALLLTCACRRAPSPGSQRPNVVLISIDCLNQRQLRQALESGYVPNIRSLASESLVFSRAYAHAPWTTPSHMSMLSGLYPSQHGRDVPFGEMVRTAGRKDHVPLFEPLPQRLGDAGYESVAFVGKGSISAAFGLGLGFKRYEEAGPDNADRSDLVLTHERLGRWLESRPAKPFFLFYHTYDLHWPLPKSRPTSRDALVAIDGRLGELVALLKRHGAYDSSVIVLTGDHGSDMIETEAKCCVHGAGHYQENLNVPLVVRLGRSGPSGERDMLVRHIDILPTVLDAVGMTMGSYKGPGVSIVRRLREADGGRISSFSEADGRCVSRYAVVDERYEYIFTPEDHTPEDQKPANFVDSLCRAHPACAQVPREEFYDLRSDPFEEHNLLGPRALSPDARAALDRLRGELVASTRLPRFYRRGGASGKPEIPADVEESMRALGYVQ